MSKTLNCPACGGPLEYARDAEITIRCPYCHNTVIVPDDLRGSLRAGGKATTATWPRSAESALASITPQQLEKEIRELLAEKQKINAIKLYRQVTGAGLKQAKEAVEAVEAGGTVDSSQLSPQVNQTYTPANDVLTISQATKLIQDGKKIAAIHLLRSYYDVSLKVAKEAADLLERGEKVDMEWLKMRAQQAASVNVKLPQESERRVVSSHKFLIFLLGVILVAAIILLTAAVW
jgi:LSD1 subclass zinc finger protein